MSTVVRGGVRTGGCVLAVLLVASPFGGRQAHAAVPTSPLAFGIPDSAFPWWQYAGIDTAKVEPNGDYGNDGGSGSASALRRLTGWYESVQLHKGQMSPFVEIRVSEFRSASDAQRAYRMIVSSLSPRDRPNSFPRLAWSAAMSSESSIVRVKGLANGERFEAASVYMWYGTLMAEAEVLDEHAPGVTFLSVYRNTAIAIASTLVKAMGRGLSGQAPSPLVELHPTVNAWTAPTIAQYDEDMALWARTSPGAYCTADVLYSTGREPTSFNVSEAWANRYGVAMWLWHEKSAGSGGTATVECNVDSSHPSASATFVIAR